MDSDDFGLGSGGAAGGHLQVDDDSFDIDASYPPPQRRTAQPRVGVGSSVRSTYGQVRQPYGSSSYRSNISTPSPEHSDVDVSLSGSMEQIPYSSAIRSSGITRKPSAVSSSAYSSSSRPGLSRSSTVARSRFTEHDDSLEELNPHNEPEYRPRDISRASTLYSSAASRPPLRTAQSMVSTGYSMPSHSRRAAPEEEEVSISFEEDEPDVRASNNTLIKKAQQIQDEEAANERERISNEQLARDRARLEEAMQEAKRNAEAAKVAEANKKKAAEEAKLREEEDRRRREEEEEDARAAEEAARLRAEAGVEDEGDKYDDKYDESDEFTEPIKVKNTNSALDALDAVLDDEEAEIERARKQLEEEEEAELRRQAEAESVSVSNSAQLGTAAFLNPPWAKDGDGASHAAAYDESADLDLARRRQEEYEEEQEEERRRKELEAKKKALEAAVEDSYDEDQEAEPVPAPGQSKLPTTSTSIPSRSVSFASDTASRSASVATARSTQDSADAAPAGVPAVFASALSTLDPQVAALVMKAIADQLVVQNTPSRPVAPAPAAMPETSQRVFDPTQSKQAAEDAWQRLLNMRSATSAPSGAPSAHPSSLPQPPLTGSNVPSWESMLAAVASSQLSKKATDQDRLFTKRAQSFTSPAIVNPYSLPSAQPFGSQYDHPQSRYVNQVLRSGLAPDSQRSSLRVENERDALKRLLSFQPGAPNNAPPIPGASDSLSRAVDEHRSLYLQDQAILNSVLRRVLTAGEQKQAEAELGARAQLKFQDDVNATSERKVSEGVPDDGRGLPADDVIRMLEEGYPFAAHDAWQYASSNTLARAVVLSAEPASQLYTRQVVDQTMRETLSELLSDAKIIAMVKKATLKKLKSRLVFDKQIQIAPQSIQQQNLRASNVER